MGKENRPPLAAWLRTYHFQNTCKTKHDWITRRKTKQNLVTQNCLLKIHILLLLAYSPAHSMHILLLPPKCIHIHLKKPHALTDDIQLQRADSSRQMFCVISVPSSRKCLFIMPRKTIPCSKTLFLCLKIKGGPKQVDSCKWLEINWLLLYSSTLLALPSTPSVTFWPIITVVGPKERKID